MIKKTPHILVRYCKMVIMFHIITYCKDYVKSNPMSFRNLNFFQHQEMNPGPCTLLANVKSLVYISRHLSSLLPPSPPLTPPSPTCLFVFWGRIPLKMSLLYFNLLHSKADHVLGIYICFGLFWYQVYGQF